MKILFSSAFREFFFSASLAAASLSGSAGFAGFAAHNISEFCFRSGSLGSSLGLEGNTCDCSLLDSRVGSLILGLPHPFAAGISLDCSLLDSCCGGSRISVSLAVAHPFTAGFFSSGEGPLGLVLSLGCDHPVVFLTVKGLLVLICGGGGA